MLWRAFHWMACIDSVTLSRILQNMPRIFVASFAIADIEEKAFCTAMEQRSKTMHRWLQSNFDLLAWDLPFCFAPNLDRVRNDLPSLFSEALPFVLSHQDLNMMNILINPKTGNITGIIDWSKSRILPFGFALYRLENLLGRMHSEGWHYYNHHRVLENLF